MISNCAVKSQLVVWRPKKLECPIFLLVKYTYTISIELSGEFSQTEELMEFIYLGIGQWRQKNYLVKQS